MEETNKALLIYSLDSLLGTAVAALSRCECLVGLPEKLDSVVEVIYIGVMPTTETLELLTGKNILTHVYDPTNHIKFVHDKLVLFGNSDLLDHIIIDKLFNHVYFIESIITSQFSDYSSKSFDITKEAAVNYFTGFIFLTDYQQTKDKLKLIYDSVNRISFFDEYEQYKLAGQAIKKIKQENIKNAMVSSIQINIDEYSVTMVPISVDLTQTSIEEFLSVAETQTNFVVFFRFAILNQMPGYLLYVYNISSNISASNLLSKFVISYETTHKYYKTWVNSAAFSHILPHVHSLVKVIVPAKKTQIKNQK